MIRLPTSRTLTIPNEICAYCGIALLSSNRSRDHVLSRKFVPHGTLHNSCNIGIWTCKKCNGFKSELEDDISAITMLIGPDGKFARDDERLINTSALKQKGAISKATKRRVAESHPEMKADIPFGAGLFSFNFVAQPTIEEQRAARLAWLQIQGIWFYQTYDPAAKRGKFLPLDRFVMAAIYSRYDWGNSHILSFTEQIESWDYQTYACLADGYFRAIVKVAPDKETLAWAVEWNDAYRCFGYWCINDNWRHHEAQLTKLKPQQMVGDTNNGWACRVEERFPDDLDDVLFGEPPDFENMEKFDAR